MGAGIYGGRLFTDRRQATPVRPATVRRGAHGTLLLAPATMRDYLGLFSDASQDAVLEELSAFAQEKIGDFVGVSLGAISVTNYFPPSGPGAVLELSEAEQLNATSVAVTYQDSSRSVQTLDAADWLLDGSTIAVAGGAAGRRAGRRRHGGTGGESPVGGVQHGGV